MDGSLLECRPHAKSSKVAFLVSQLKHCAEHKNISEGIRIHELIAHRGLLRSNIHLGSTLITMYAKCGSLARAQQVFESLPFQDVVCWTALISGYAQSGDGEQALLCFELMQSTGVAPNSVTLSCVLRACGGVGALKQGQEIHGEIARKGLLDRDIVLANALVDMYAKCGAFMLSRQVMDSLATRDVVCWTALISGYSQYKRWDEAFASFTEMQKEGLTPNPVTFACALQACGNLQVTEKCGELHAELARLGILEKDIVLGNALVDMYAKCGLVAKAQAVFDKLSLHDVVSWTSLITGYAQQGVATEALKYFEKMKDEGIIPNAVTILCILQVCGSIGAAEMGERIHAEMIRKGIWGTDITLDTALVDMYAKCSSLTKAQRVFNELTAPNVVSWTALMAGFAQAGQHTKVFVSFKRMIVQGVQPTSVTFLSLLSACSSLELVQIGETYFETMTSTFGILPSAEHYTCMVDLFSRAGQFDRAVEAINQLPDWDHLPAWFALLSACRKWGNTTLGGWAHRESMRFCKPNNEM